MSVYGLQLIAVCIGFVLDLIFGDPHWLYHPVQAIGKLIEVTEKLLRKIFPSTKSGERTAGVILVVIVVAVSTAVPALLLWVLYKLHVIAGLAVESFMCYQLLATKSLKTESDKVYVQLAKGDLPAARYAVSMIVGRDTAELTEEGVTKAAVETVAENASDGILAPLLYMTIGGAVLGFTYKSVNTMDSMVGYKNDKYRYFGTCAALLDDVLNFIPARLSGLLMVAASFIVGMDGKNALKIFLRDRKKHASPNSAHTEAVMAGALGIRLAGDAWYFGKLHKKDYIGDDLRPVEILDIRRSHRLLYATSILSLVIFGGLKLLLLFCTGSLWC